MIIYGLFFLLAAGALLYALVSLVRWVRSAERRITWAPLRRLMLIAAAVWLSAFCLPFLAEWLGNGADSILGATWLFTLIAGTVLASRSFHGPWGPISGGTVLAGAVLTAAIGIYAMHAIGWQSLSLDDLRSEGGITRLWVGALFFAPGAFALGFLLGLLSSRLMRRRLPAPQ